MKKISNFFKSKGRSGAADHAFGNNGNNVPLTRPTGAHASCIPGRRAACQEPPLVKLDRPACLAEIQDIRSSITQVHNHAAMPAPGGLGSDGWQAVVVRQELVRLHLQRAGCHIRLVRPLDTNSGSSKYSSEILNSSAYYDNYNRPKSSISNYSKSMLACGGADPQTKRVLFPFYHITSADRPKICACKSCCEQICQGCSQIEARVWQLDARQQEWSTHELVHGDDDRLAALRDDADRLWVQLLHLVQQARKRSCMAHADGSGWNAGQPPAKRQKRSSVRRLFDCLNPAAGFGPRSDEEEVWRGSSYNAFPDEPARQLQPIPHQAMRLQQEELGRQQPLQAVGDQDSGVLFAKPPVAPQAASHMVTQDLFLDFWDDAGSAGQSAHGLPPMGTHLMTTHQTQQQWQGPVPAYPQPLESKGAPLPVQAEGHPHLKPGSVPNGFGHGSPLDAPAVDAWGTPSASAWLFPDPTGASKQRRAVPAW
ncbi:hypothetical protein WJX84_008416 [Apatococcus fuscideae]|uniref:Uncharacterized protein n=1 Tax=Apatococcus fuscideae TaxID=2026836 RepID=A0AAW1SN13_9CHLO